MAEAELFIGGVAARAGIHPRTIRYYESIGVLPAPSRGENGHRRYRKEAVDLLQFVKKAQGLGFTLGEIKEILELRRAGREPCVHLRALVERKIADLDQQLRDLVGLRRNLKRLLASSEQRATQGKAKAVACVHIEKVHQG